MTTSPTGVSVALQTATRKAAARLIPLVMLMYVISYLDRVNIGFAAAKMNADLGLSTAAYGLGAGLFFIGYVLFEVPSNVILHRLGARLWLARIMVTWGLISGVMGFVQSELGFYMARVLLGIAEAGFVPGVIYLLTLWFPSQVRARMVALFIIAIPFAVVLGAPLSAVLIEHGHGLFGLEGWRFMFLAEAIPAVVVGIVVFFVLPSSPKNVLWLTDDERTALCSTLESEADSAAEHGPSDVYSTLKDWRIYAVSFIGFSVNMGGYALSFFLPQVVANLAVQFDQDFSIWDTALLTAIPFVAAAAAVWLVGRSSDRHQERHFHAAIPLLVGAIAVSIALYLPNTTLVMIAISIAAAGSYSVLPVFWQLPPRFLTGAAAAAGIGVAGGLANVAGFVAPYMTGGLETATGSYKPAMFVVAAFMAMGACVALMLRRRPEFASSAQPGAPTRR
ncbi:sugar phosphate permease [Kribbella sp. VKM Ac-2569]|uniref:MFS transporter n=1 Tax=Kribbella sp. VKM Ac-2569 TaxID=2512220 RepID=UPI00102B540D|nr:MFS transporter [Kribbella sp. VKM Ac-2569]RZT28537.1 sugar phosphate permease [Kribbella sp. VKM Ac-2569]